MEIKSLVANPIFIFIICFLIFMFSINEILNLAKPSESILIDNNIDDELYHVGYDTVSLPNQDYQKVTMMINKRFPNIPDASLRAGIPPEISALPIEKQKEAIKLNIIKNRINYLEAKFKALSQTKSILLKLGFYLWGFIGWVSSVVLGHMLTHITAKINTRYIDEWFDEKFSKTSSK